MLGFWRQRITDERKELEDRLGSTPEPEILVKLMLTTKEKWSDISNFATTVMKRLREEEQERRKTRRPTKTGPRNKQRECGRADQLRPPPRSIA